MFCVLFLIREYACVVRTAYEVIVFGFVCFHYDHPISGRI